MADEKCSHYQAKVPICDLSGRNCVADNAGYSPEVADRCPCYNLNLLADAVRRFNFGRRSEDSEQQYRMDMRPVEERMAEAREIFEKRKEEVDQSRQRRKSGIWSLFRSFGLDILDETEQRGKN